MKFRKKPVVIEAEQFWPPQKPWPEGVTPYSNRMLDSERSRECLQCGWLMSDHGWINTLEGGHIVCPRDHVITGVKGERYPCKPDIFEETYDPVE